MSKKKSAFKLNRDEILYNIINSVIAGALVFVGSMSDGVFTKQGAVVAFAASFVVALVKFRDYWSGQEQEYIHRTSKALAFV